MFWTYLIQFPHLLCLILVCTILGICRNFQYFNVAFTSPWLQRSHTEGGLQASKVSNVLFHTIPSFTRHLGTTFAGGSSGASPLSSLASLHGCLHKAWHCHMDGARCSCKSFMILKGWTSIDPFGYRDNCSPLLPIQSEEYRGKIMARHFEYVYKSNRSQRIFVSTEVLMDLNLSDLERNFHSSFHWSHCRTRHSWQLITNVN